MKPVKMCSVQSCDFCVTDEKVFETWKRTECFGESNCANGDDAYENCSRRKAQFMFKTAADEDVCWEQCAPHAGELSEDFNDLPQPPTAGQPPSARKIKEVH